MIFVIFCLDKPGMLEKRAETMPAHRAYVDTTDIQQIMSGPLVDDDGETPIGSLYVVEAENRVALEEYQRNDPLVQADIWKSMEVRAFDKRVDNRG